MNAKTICREQIARSRWFSRGWTLQELIAPTFVFFLDRMWQAVGPRTSFVVKPVEAKDSMFE